MTAKDLLSLQGKAALVTGASSGFGRHFARVLAGAGAKVALAARRLDVLEQLASEIRADGGEAAALAMDVTDRASVAKAVAGAEAALGPITILVNNAGVPSGAFFTKTSEEEWRSVMSVNLDGVFRVGQEAARRMAANRTGGSIINIASLLGFGVIKGFVHLLSHQGRGDQPHEIHGAGAGARPHPRQCAGSRLFRHRVQRRISLQRGRQAHDGTAYRWRAPAPCTSSTGRCCCSPPKPGRS
jgi:NAD(P)-dependent dehydrogenase (short-subunit alcohol dehydrogenase family)